MSWLRVAAPRGMSPGGGVVRTGHDGRTADGRWTEHQRGRRADRAGARHDPHVGAAPRLPQPAAHRLGLPPLRRPTTSRRCAARAPTASAASRWAPRSSARARRAAASDHPSIYAAVAGDRPRRAPAGPAQVDPGRAVAGHRARAARARRRAGALRGLPARALLSRAGAALPPAGAPRRRRDGVRRLPRAAPALGRAGRGADRRGRGAGQRVGGDRRRARLRGVPAGLGAARRDRARGPRTAIGASRRSGPSIRARPAARRRRPRGWRATPTRSTGAGSRSSWPTARWRMEQPAPALTALTNRLLAYVEAAGGS